MLCSVSRDPSSAETFSFIIVRNLVLPLEAPELVAVMTEMSEYCRASNYLTHIKDITCLLVLQDFRLDRRQILASST